MPKQKSLVLNIGDGYKIKATRKDTESFMIVFVEWEHPNYGYFSDAMLWVNSLHAGEWLPFPLVNWSEEYKNVGEFIKDFPQFDKLFTM